MSGERITQSEFARRNGWTRQYVAKLVKQGRIRLEGGKIDPVAAKRTIDNQAEPSTVWCEKPVTRHTIVGDEEFLARRMVQDLLRPIPNRMAVVLAAESSPERIQQLLQNEIEDVLTVLSDILSALRQR